MRKAPRTRITTNDVHYQTVGEGNPIVLLHGYLAAAETWTKFALQLGRYYKIISIDLPGHGKTKLPSEDLTMEIMADAVNDVLEYEQIKRTLIVGHSMGGYVTLAFAKKYYDKVIGFSLFHSHPFADPKAVVEKRKKEINLVKSGKKKLIIETSIPYGFANDNLDSPYIMVLVC